MCQKGCKTLTTEIYKERMEEHVAIKNNYPLLVFHVASHEVAKRSPRTIKRDFKALGQLIKGPSAWIAISSILPLPGNNIERNRQMQVINTWPQDWCHQQNVGFLCHGIVNTTAGLLVPDGLHLSQRGERIFAHELSGLMY